MESRNRNQGWRNLILASAMTLMSVNSFAENWPPNKSREMVAPSAIDQAPAANSPPEPPSAPTPSEGAQNPAPPEPPAPPQVDDDFNDAQRRLVAEDSIDLAADCKVTQDEIKRLIKAKKLDAKKIDKQSAKLINNCSEFQKDYYKAICDAMPGFCATHVIAGNVVWGIGGELNINFSSKSEVRAVVGLGTFSTVQERSNRFSKIHRPVLQLAYNQQIGYTSTILHTLKIRRSAGEPVQETETKIDRPDIGVRSTYDRADGAQLVFLGFSFIWIPAAQDSRVTLKDLLYTPPFPTSTMDGVWSAVKAARNGFIGGEAEFKAFWQSDAQQKNAFEVSVLTYGRGLGSLTNFANPYGEVDASTIWMTSVLHSIGKIRNQSLSFEAMTMIDPSKLSHGKDDD